MEIARRSKNLTSIVSMDAGTVFKYANEYWMTTSTVDRITGSHVMRVNLQTNAVDCITDGYVMCVNLQTGELKSFHEGTVCEYFTDTKLLIG